MHRMSVGYGFVSKVDFIGFKAQSPTLLTFVTNEKPLHFTRKAITFVKLKFRK